MPLSARVVCVLLLACATEAPRPPCDDCDGEPAPALACTPEDLDLGRALPGRTARGVVTCRNEGDRDVIVEAEPPRAPFILESSTRVAIPAGRETLFDVAFRPSEGDGAVTGELVLRDETGDALATIALSGRTENSGVTCAPEAIEFEPTGIGLSRTRVVSCAVSADEPGPIEVEVLEVTGPFNARMRDVRGADAGVRATYLPGQAFDVGVTFAPEQEGPASGIVLLATGANAKVLAMAGVGVARPPCDLEASPSDLHLFAFDPNEVVTGTLWLRNAGASSCTVLRTRLARRSHPVFRPLELEGPVELPAGGELRIAYSITIDVAQVSLFGRLRVDVESGEPLYVGLVAQAWGPCLGFSALYNLNLGDRPAGCFLLRTVELRNRCIDPVVLDRVELVTSGDFSLSSAPEPGSVLAPGVAVPVEVAWTPSCTDRDQASLRAFSPDGTLAELYLYGRCDPAAPCP